MDVIQSINDVLNKLQTLGKDGIPLNHSVDTKTVNNLGMWIVGGLLLAGLAAGGIVGLILSSRKR
ncbi:hypothetical protein BWI97_14250 [Siphonobacter sp. BAB-5405]|uniref:hypothetical protein n=1 Tax=Siphonobacter sp. BAB-5405 TaxID=1864825 RepID=UPI000C8031B3|nr:hypothetical protein [Siphonobacter sp. BAB-5405]PMD95513.1 hypothetical protein BWI97_14250 [Siphonobacter sp. BAB-5405]